MQEQQVRQSCHAIAGQLFLLDPVQHGRQDGHNTSSSIGSADAFIARSGALSNSTPSTFGAANENASSAVTAASSSGPDKKNSRADDLRRVCEAVVRDAMTLYRLCHRPGGGGVAIVLGPSSSSGGGGGAAVEEAAYCVCAAIMAREETLWSSLVWRAQLLRPRKPTLCFAPPVMMPPVVVKDVVKFFGRSRHLVKSASGVTVAATASPATLASAESPTATVPRPPAIAPPTTTAAALNGGNVTAALTPQQAEAVAAAFFFKTMSAAERQRRPEILAIRVAASPSLPTGGKVDVVSSSGKPAGAAPHNVGSSAGASTASLPLQQRTSGTGHGFSSAPSPSPIAAALAALKGRNVPGNSSSNDQAARQSARRSLHLPRTSSSLLLMDDWSGWGGGGGGDALRQRGTRKDAVTAAGEAGRGCSRSSSSSSSSSGSSGDSGISRRSVGSEGHHVKGLSSGSGQDRGRVAGQGHAADAGGRRRDRHAKAAAAAEAAVLERLYRLATDADTTLANEEEETERSRGDTALEVGSGGGDDGGVSSSMFTGGKGLSLISLAAMTTQVQDTLHWGRLTALVRFPLLFRGFAAPALVPPSVMAAVQLTSTSEALTAASMASMSNALGASYTSTWMPTAAPPFLAGASAQCAEGLQAGVETFVSTYGAPGSFLCPARLRTSSSSLLPPPPSLVTDGFLWTRLLVCSAWLVVYADSLLDEGDVSEEADEAEEASALVRPRVQPSAAVQEMVTYCVTVLREARAISAGMTGEKDAAASSSSPYHVSGGESNGGVCCPVCDRLVKEQLPVLWWSTLREDRTQLRAQVQALLENGSANDAEAQVAAQVATDGVREGRGGRQYATPLLRGSGAASQQVAALQRRWGMYIMGVADPVEKEKATEIEDGNHGTARETTETLWAALTQRVAATADLCAFVSTHRMQDTHLSSAKTRAAAAAGSSRQGRGHRARVAIGGHGERGKRTRKRRRRSDSSEETDEEEEGEEEEELRHSSGSESDSGDVDQRARRRAGSISSGEGATPVADAGEATAPSHGSRHAHEVAEEWEGLLRRCGWVTAAPPRASANASARSAADVAVYTRWAASLGQSAAGPSPQQATALRHRLSEYCLSDVTRALVLGRGGKREQYSALLFGAEAVVPSSADWSPAAPCDLTRGQADRQRETCVSEPVLLPPSSAATHRAASMSLLEESTRELLSPSAGVSEVDEKEEAEGKAAKCLTTPSTSPPALTSPNSFAPLSPSSPSSAPAVTPNRRSALLSIPLHVSPRARPAVPDAKAAPPLLSDTREAVDVEIEGGRSASASLCASSTHRPVSSTSPQLPAEARQSKHPAVTGCVAARSQLVAQRDALYALLDFHPRFPPLREEDAVVECGRCFSLFHQDCIAPVQRDLQGQVFLCHACRLRWARPYVGVEKAGGGLFHQAQALSQLQGCKDERKSFS